MKTILSLFLFSFLSFSQARATCTLDASIENEIGVGTSDYLQRAENQALKDNCSSILLRINTPGGDLQSTRKIITQIMNSSIPYLCLVTPSGGHAGSAGAIILQACHVSGAMRATNIGAATPISSDGKNISDDLRKKIFNDTLSLLEGITKARGRNLDFSEKIVTEAKSLSADEAAKIGAIDVVVDRIEDFLKFAEGRKVKFKNETSAVTVGALQVFSTDLRYSILQMVADPQISYLLFLGSLGLLYFEFTHPGVIIPGVVGSLGLILSLISFYKLDVQWGGVALLLLGLAFFIAEAFVSSFGALGIGGLVAFTLGGLFLYDPATTHVIPKHIIFSSSFILALFLFVVSYLALSARRVEKRGAFEGAVGSAVTVIYIDAQNPEWGAIEWKGERWKCVAPRPLVMGERVKIDERKGFHFIVS